MKALLPIDHTEALEALRSEMIKEITTYVPKTGKIEFFSGGFSKSTTGAREELYLQGNEVRYYGHQYSGYNDRYDCHLSCLSTDILSGILTELENDN